MSLQYSDIDHSASEGAKVPHNLERPHEVLPEPVSKNQFWGRLTLPWILGVFVVFESGLISSAFSLNGPTLKLGEIVSAGSRGLVGQLSVAVVMGMCSAALVTAFQSRTMEATENMSRRFARNAASSFVLAAATVMCAGAISATWVAFESETPGTFLALVLGALACCLFFGIAHIEWDDSDEKRAEIVARRVLGRMHARDSLRALSFVSSRVTGIVTADRRALRVILLQLASRALLMGVGAVVAAGATGWIAAWGLLLTGQAFLHATIVTAFTWLFFTEEWVTLDRARLARSGAEVVNRGAVLVRWLRRMFLAFLLLLGVLGWLAQFLTQHYEWRTLGLLLFFVFVSTVPSWILVMTTSKRRRVLWWISRPVWELLAWRLDKSEYAPD